MSKRLPFEVKQMLSKARESALLAVEVYNKPATKFKSGGYVVLMTIAWTSLFHAVFIRLKSATYRVSWEFTCKTTKILLLYIFLAQQKCR